MVAEVVCICDSVPDRKEIFDLFMECYPEEIHKVNKVDFSFVMRDVRFKFTIPSEEIAYLKARRNSIIVRPWYFRQILMDGIERGNKMNRHYEVIFRETDEGIIETSATGEGFNCFELIGLMEVKMRDLYEQIMRPEMFEHTRVVKTEDGYEKIEEKENE